MSNRNQPRPERHPNHPNHPNHTGHSDAAKLKAVMDSGLDDQLEDPKIPEVKEQYERLLGEGISQQKTRRLIGCILVRCINRVLFGKELTYEDYVEELAQLPQIEFREEDAVIFEGMEEEYGELDEESMRAAFLAYIEGEDMNEEEWEEDSGEEEEVDEILETLAFHAELMIAKADHEAGKSGCPFNDSQIRSTLMKACKLLEGDQPDLPEGSLRDRLLKKLALDLFNRPGTIIEQVSYSAGNERERPLPNKEWIKVLEKVSQSLNDIRSKEPGSRRYLDYIKRHIPAR